MPSPTPRWGRVYPLACALALFSLCPYLVLAASSQFLMRTVEAGVHTGPLGLSLVEAGANTGFAVGALASADLAQRFESHRLFLLYAGGFVVGAVVTGVSPDIGCYAVGRSLMGSTAGLLLIGALPQLIRRYDADHLPITGLVVNVGLFSATVAGPSISGVVASAGAWRALFLIIGGMVGVAVLLGFPGFESVPPERPDLGVDRPALLLAAIGAALPLFGTSLLVRTDLPRWWTILAAAAGVVILTGMLVTERHLEARGGREPSRDGPDVLIPASALGTSIPLTGTLVASVGGLVTLGLISLSELLLHQVDGQSTARSALLLLPLVGGLAIAGAAYRAVFTTRWVFALIAVGFATLIGGGGVLYAAAPHHPGRLVPLAATLIGFGAGATVSPGLFLASLGVPSAQLARTFAAVELLRNEFTFALVPVIVAVAGGARADLATARLAILGTIGVAALGGALIATIAAASGLRPATPQLQRWLDEDGLGLPSPRLPGLTAQLGALGPRPRNDRGNNSRQ